MNEEVLQWLWWPRLWSTYCRNWQLGCCSWTKQEFHGRRVSSFEAVNCDFLYFAITINDQIFLIQLQHWKRTGIRTLEGVTMSTMVNVDKTGVPKVTGNVCWSSAMVLCVKEGGGTAECIEF